MGLFFLPTPSVRRKASRFHANGVWGGSGGRRGGGECGAAAVGGQTAGPAQQVTAHAGEQGAGSRRPQSRALPYIGRNCGAACPPGRSVWFCVPPPPVPPPARESGTTVSRRRRLCRQPARPA